MYNLLFFKSKASFSLLLLSQLPALKCFCQLYLFSSINDEAHIAIYLPVNPKYALPTHKRCYYFRSFRSSMSSPPSHTYVPPPLFPISARIFLPPMLLSQLIGQPCFAVLANWKENISCRLNATFAIPHMHEYIVITAFFNLVFSVTWILPFSSSTFSRQI